MIRKCLFLCVIIFVLAACSGEGLPAIQDSSELVTLPPSATVTAVPTSIPTTEDASGIGLAFFKAWEVNDILGMYSLLTPQSQAVVGSQPFVNLYEQAMKTATVKEIQTQPLGIIQEGNNAEMEIRVIWKTAAVGDIIRDLTVPMRYENGRWGIVWDEGLILPELAGGNQLVMDRRIPARANIYDKNGKALAYQGTILSLGVIPGQIEDEAGMLAALSPVLNKTPEEIKEIYAPAQPDWYWPIGNIAEETMQTYGQSLQPYIGKGLAAPQPRLARLYSDAKAAPHIVGYTGFIPEEQIETYRTAGYAGDEQVGLAGIEAWGEDYLNGQQGGTLSVYGPNGEFIATIQEQEPKQARSIYTTLDLDFQIGVEQILNDAISRFPGGQRGAAVVMDVNTGKVLAMASYPTFDPTIFDAMRPEAAVELGQVFSDPNNPLLNRAAQGAYPAGSLFKVVTFTAGMNSGLYTPESRYSSTGTWGRLGENFIKRDWLDGGHGTISMRQAIVVSCNSCFYDMAFELDGYDPFFFPNTARAYGLGQETGIVGINETPGLIPDPDWKLAQVGEGWVTGDAVNMGIGQGFVQVTPLQIATIFAAFANGGILYQPSLIDRIGAGGGAPEEPFPVQVNGEVPLEPANLQVLRDSLYSVTTDSWGTAEFVFGGLNPLAVPVAGKTGTAEAPPNNSHAWFAGYAPAAPYTRQDGLTITEPEIAVVVIVENSGEGSEVAAPIVRQIIERYYGITPLTPLPW